MMTAYLNESILTALLALGLTACSSKVAADKPEGSSGTKKTIKDGDDSDDAGDKDDAETDDPCAELADDGDDPCETEQPPPPDGAFYETVLNPPQKETCHTQAKLFSFETQACLDVSYPAAFKCDRAGVLAAFSNAAEVASELDKREGLKYRYDQCGVDANSKPYVILACPTTQDQDCEGAPACKTQEDLDVDAIKICETKLHF